VRVRVSPWRCGVGDGTDATTEQAGGVLLIKWERQDASHIDILYLTKTQYNSISAGALISPQ